MTKNNQVIEYSTFSDKGVSKESFQLLELLFLKAAGKSGGIKQFFCKIAGFKVRLCFASEAFNALTIPALEHVSIPPTQPTDLTICLWDSASTGTGQIDIQLGLGLHEARVDQNQAICEDIFSAFQTGPDVLSILDMKKNRALCWAEDAQKLPIAEMGAPLKMIFSRWFAERGLQMIHGGAVGTSEGGIILAGKGGSGKSTCALSCIGSNLSYLSDDYCLIALNPHPEAYSLYGTGKMDASGLHRFPAFSDFMANKDTWMDEKAIYLIHSLYPDQMITTFPVKAIVVPCIASCAEPEITILARAKALASLAPSTIFQLPVTCRRSFHLISAFVKRVPAFQMKMGPDISKIPVALQSLLDELDEPGVWKDGL